MWLGHRLVELGRKDMHAYAPGVPVAELIVMEDLLRNAPTSIGPVAERTGYAQSRVSTAVTALSARGWVDVAPDPQDRRRTLVRIPAEIEAAATELRSGTEARTLALILDELPEERSAAISKALEELLDVLQQVGVADAGRPPAADG